MEDKSIAKDRELDEEELGNVSGGGWFDIEPKEAWKTQAASEGRNIFVVLNRMKEAHCYSCGKYSSIFAKEKANIKSGPDEYRDCKCYCCGKLLGNYNTEGYAVK